MEMGFIGLGGMGEPMARNLIKAGHVVESLQSHPQARGGVGESGCNLGGDAGGGMHRRSGRHACWRMTPRWKAWCSANTAFWRACPAAASTFPTARLARTSLAASSTLTGSASSFLLPLRFSDVPDAAQAARLIVVAAGPPEAVERCHPALEAIGRKLFVIGPDPPAANTVKLAGNFLIASMLETLGEAFALLRKSGVDPATFLEIMVGSFFQSPIYENYGKIIAEQRYEPAGFKLRLGLKDVRLVMAAADEAAAPMPIASLIRDNMISGIAQGLGDLDWSAVARVAALKSGLKN